MIISTIFFYSYSMDNVKTSSVNIFYILKIKTQERSNRLHDGHSSAAGGHFQSATGGVVAKRAEFFAAPTLYDQHAREPPRAAHQNFVFRCSGLAGRFCEGSYSVIFLLRVLHP